MQGHETRHEQGGSGIADGKMWGITESTSRSFSGVLADQLQSPWSITFIGHAWRTRTIWSYCQEYGDPWPVGACNATRSLRTIHASQSMIRNGRDTPAQVSRAVA
jgi:hypothetical protein